MTRRTLRKLKNRRKDALIITAHPDDESIFMGGTIAEFKKWRWRLLCVTDCDKRYNARRRRELLRACGIYKKGGTEITPFMLEVVKENGRFRKKEIAYKLKHFILNHPKPDIVFTHNKRGEYGHKTHKLVNRIVKTSGLRHIYTFSFGAGPKNSRQMPEKVSLSGQSLLIKKRAVRMYLKGSQKTNLSRLKYLVGWTLKAREEWFNIDY